MKKNVILIVLILLVSSLVSAVVSHEAEQIIPGIFGNSYLGNWSFMNGSVGIGTTSPTEKLDVNGWIKSGNATTSVVLGHSQSTDSGFTGTITNNDFYIRINNLNRVIIDKLGNLGIGTTSPVEKLTVNGSYSQYGRLMLINNNRTSQTTYSLGSLRFGTAEIESFLSTSNVLGLHSNAYRNSSFSFNYVQDKTSELISLHNGSFYFENAPVGTSNTEIDYTTRFVIDSSGNVGIGTTNPWAKLTISETTKTALYVTQSNNDYPAAEFYNGGGNGAGIAIRAGSIGNSFPLNVSRSDGTFLFGVTGAGNIGIGTSSPNANLVIQDSSLPELVINHSSGKFVVLGAGTDGSYLSYDSSGYFALASQTGVGTSGWSEKLRVDSSGNVGIGTTSPGRILDIFDSTTDTIPILSISKNASNGSFGSSQGAGMVILNRNNNTGNIGFIHFHNYDNTETANQYGAFIKAYSTTSQAIPDVGLTFEVNDGVDIYASEAMRITPSGNVGVGTEEPTRKLHVKSGSIIEDTSSGTIKYMIDVSNQGNNGNVTILKLNITGSAVTAAAYVKIHGTNNPNSGTGYELWEGVGFAKNDTSGLTFSIAPLTTKYSLGSGLINPTLAWDEITNYERNLVIDMPNTYSHYTIEVLVTRRFSNGNMLLIPGIESISI